MALEYSPDGHLLYVHLREGEVAETAEVGPDIYADLDADGRPIGVEFLNADDFFPFLSRGLEGMRGTTVQVPRTLEIQVAQMLGADLADEVPADAPTDTLHEGTVVRRVPTSSAIESILVGSGSNSANEQPSDPPTPSSTLRSALPTRAK